MTPIIFKYDASDMLVRKMVRTASSPIEPLGWGNWYLTFLPNIVRTDPDEISSLVGFKPDHFFYGSDLIEIAPLVSDGGGTSTAEVAQVIRSGVALHGTSGKGQNVVVMDTGVNPVKKLARVVGERVSMFDGEPIDDHGHGTMVADCIYAVAPRIKRIHSCKILDAFGRGSMYTVLRGCQWVIENASRLNIHGLNASFGCYRDDCDGDQNACPNCSAFNEMAKRGICVVAAAGNDGPQTRTIGCPSKARETISVAAVDMDGHTANFSSRGPGGVDNPTVASYGVAIKMTNHKGDEVVASGTSFASPFVLGTAMSIREMLIKRNMGHRNLNEFIKKSCLPAKSNDPDEIGAGIPNLKKASDKIGNPILRLPTRRGIAAAACIGLLFVGGLNRFTTLNKLEELDPGNYFLVGRVEAIGTTTIRVSDISDSVTLPLRKVWQDGMGIKLFEVEVNEQGVKASPMKRWMP